MRFDPRGQIRVLGLWVILLGAADVGSAAAQAPARVASPGALFDKPGSRSRGAMDPTARAAHDIELLELARRLAVLAGGRDASLVAFPIEHGQRALGKASLAQTNGQPKVARHAKQTVCVPLDLAEHMLARNALRAGRACTAALKWA